MKIKRGTGSKTNVLNDVVILIISCSNPEDPPKKQYIPIILINIKEKATGIAEAISIRRLPNIMIKKNSQLITICPFI